MTGPAPDAALAALRRGDLAGARALRLPGLSEIPEELFGLADSLEVLDIGGGSLAGLPDGFARLGRLSTLYASGNRFERLPPVLGACPALTQILVRDAGVRAVPAEALPPGLRWLTLTGNRIAHLPDALGERPALAKLLLSGNRLTALPASLARAGNLELIRLSANALDALPAWLAGLPGLAWASWGGNPCEPDLAAPRAPAIPWAGVRLGERLGGGASGEVHRAELDGGGPVALKLFRGAMTSDGLPEREMAACLAAGDHPNLTGAVGRLVGHPAGIEGLALRLIPPGWRPLAGPPSRESCTRDVYAPDLGLAPAVALRLARSVAGAAAHLHAGGLMHGDLYAHNVLWDEASGEAVVSDFGAASVLPAGTAGAAWRRVEVRAFGLLCAELAARCTGGPPAGLAALASACTTADPAARPGLREAVAALDSLIAGSA